MRNVLALAGAAIFVAFIAYLPVVAAINVALFAAMLVKAFIPELGAGWLAVRDAFRAPAARSIARIAAVAVAVTAALLCVAGPSYALDVPLDCIPLGGDALIPAPAWLPPPLQPFWTAIVTVPLAGWVMAHVRAWLPNDPRLAIALGVLDKLVGNYGWARNAAGR
ncbi:hypothetical protein [Methylosinus sp. Sm6]|uniref:hypothetical protein n=1 Tax=Methylosinus sp. Sm6 TaxID=2866948 RepID=UPI001C9A145D|nr:hypothetical protein [Methylosinus sp. Sm6]MBY6239799.1 hypothetical protein [Methylosinus sp. Sm6]